MGLYRQAWLHGSPHVPDRDNGRAARHADTSHLLAPLGFASRNGLPWNKRFPSTHRFDWLLTKSVASVASPMFPLVLSQKAPEWSATRWNAIGRVVTITCVVQPSAQSQF